ncbi:carboxypeptidase-like regulatory domain-containing protein [Paenibacillus sp. V4I5]|uniref:carboxypeptidase-like regulatory domain-containing protein n=1 Tax=Paenibacillus sp. V4I5 TaxID=3042306 RepID=UPI00278ED2E7|nr:carboxypeptidase-like regulatory domain-containing protein [Paenibacillus sp. V4I5]MDQ0917328.1 hypothetical protein [Paenibacillus sp. V4I5]
MKKLKLSLISLTLLGILGSSAVQAAVPFDSDGDGIHLDDIVTYINTYGVTDINDDGVSNSLDVKAMVRQISPVSIPNYVSTGAVTGLVVDQIGEPMNLVAVNLKESTKAALTNEHGRFTISDMEASTGNTVTSAVYESDSTPFTILSGEVTNLSQPIQVTLPTGTVTGTVYAANMVPLAGVSVKINTGGAASEVLPPTVTDSQGQFVFPNVPVGNRSFFTTSSYGMSGFVVNVKEGLNQVTDVMGVQFVSVSGIATDSRYNPLSGAEITMEMSNGLRTTVISGTDGKFIFTNAIQDMYFSWKMSKPGYLDATLNYLMDTASAHITNRSFMTLSTAPVSSDSELAYAVGANVNQFNVNLGGYSGPVKRSYSSYSFLISDKMDEPNNQVAFIGGSGQAEAGNVERLNAALLDSRVSTIYIYKSIVGLSSQSLVIPSRPVTIVSDADVFIQANVPTNHTLTWTNVKQISYGDIFGFVKGENHAPVFGATITLTGATSRTTTADINGFYHFKNLNAGSHTLSAYRSSDYSTQIYPTLVDNSSPAFRDFTLERSAQYIAATMVITNPSIGQTLLTMPVVPAGYTVSIESSNDIMKISNSGIITLGAASQSVNVIFKVMHGESDVGYRSATLTVPGLP